MASWLLSSIQSLSGKVLGAIQESFQDQNKAAVEDDLKQLSRMLQRIEAVQQDAEEREICDRSVELWLRELRGVAHEAEDVLDEYHYEVLKSIVENRSVSIESSQLGSKSEVIEMCTPSSLASSLSAIEVLTPNGIASNIKRIRESFEEISKHRTDLHFTVEDGERRILGPKRRPPTSSLIDEKSLFGRENEREEIIHLLNLEDGPDFMVVSIVGKGGLGKTTLAQLVYNDSRVFQLFKKRAWISVSDDFDLVRLTKATIESINKESCSLSELNNLQHILKEKLNGSRLFLVLDDVWNEEKNLWERFRVVFNGCKLVRILITTRSYSIAKIMQTALLFSLDHLPEEKCWMLFKHCAFDNQEENEHTNLLEIGHHIVKKCNGLPLAVKVLGGLLRYEEDEEKWREVLESDTWALDEKNEIMPVLSLSYHFMPLHLRPCFLYLSVFPKDTKLDKDIVVRLWMAQGYINSRPNRTLEDMGRKCFEELQCRSLVDSINDDTYVLHDLIHDLARSIIGRMYTTHNKNEEWNNSFAVHHLYLNRVNIMPSYIVINNHRSVRTLLNYELNEFQIDHPIILTMVCLRVLELDMACTELPDAIGILKHLRYLKVGGHELKSLSGSLCVLYNLQALDLRDCDSLLELPRDIGNLINLRCLLLCSGEIKKLPDSICYLQNLQILELNGCNNLKKLPSEMERLTSLRVLELSLHCTIYMPSGFGKLTNLQTVRGNLNAEGDTMRGGLGELKNLNSLRGSLFIRGLKNITDVDYVKEANLKSKVNLQCLELDFPKCYYADPFESDLCLRINDSSTTEHSMNNNIDEIEESVLESLQPHCNIKELKIWEYEGTKFPSWIGDPLIMSKLTNLTLFSCCTKKYNFLPPLGRLPSLEFLSINSSNVEKIGDEFCRDGSSHIAFPALEELLFENMSKWEEWIGVVDADFPCLKKLSILHCPKLKKIPIIPNELEQLEIIDCGMNENQLILPSKMKDVEISYCRGLTSVIGLHEQNFLRNLILECCPLLDIPMNSFMQSTTANITICNCPRLNIASFKNIFFYMIDHTLKKIREADYHAVIFPDTSFTLVYCVTEVLTNQFLEKISFQQSMVLVVPELEKLEVPCFANMDASNTFKYLKHLCIIGCPNLSHWKQWKEYMPESLEYLQVSHCYELTRIPALDMSIALREIRIQNCPKLNEIRGLHCLTSLRTLCLGDCQNLRIMPSKKLQIRLQTVTIYNCPAIGDWCQLNNFFHFKNEMNKRLHYLTIGEGSSSFIDRPTSDS
ncbi:hypothetical protein LUZ60_011538 [Juncus effusus]|nr:hypothetical protein LUZ60_011538 [Juncus effusus]